MDVLNFYFQQKEYFSVEQSVGARPFLLSALNTRWIKRKTLNVERKIQICRNRFFHQFLAQNTCITNKCYRL